MPNTSRATMEPIVANCASCSADALEFAPRSRMCVCPPLRAGTEDMMGARSTGPTVLSTKCAMAVSAPVLPALTMPAARPSFTRSMAMRIEESLRRRMASRGCSDMPTTLAAGCTLSARAHAGRRARERGLDDLGFADEDELEGGIGGERAQGAGNAFRRTAVTTHHIDGDGRHASRARTRNGPAGRNYSSVSTSAGFSMTRLPR